MNLILLEPDELDARGRAVLAGRRARHVRRVLGAAPGDRVRVGVIRGARGTAEIVAIRAAPGGDDARGDDGAIEIAVALTEPACPRPRVDLVLALPRPKALGRALQTAAALGVGRIDLVNAWRVDKSYFQAARIAPDALRAELVAGCEQGATTWLPDVAVHRLLMPFLDRAFAARTCPAAVQRDDGRGELADADAGPAVGVILHPRAAARLEHAVPPGGRARVVVAIGPERGWIDRELATFAARGFTPVSLGERVLKVETALAAALGQLALLARMSASRT